MKEEIGAEVVRVGIVSEIFEQGREARVFFADVEIMSGRLTVLSRHKEGVEDWTPQLGKPVLCLYRSCGDGFILGGLE